MAAPATTNFHGSLPIILSGAEGHATGDGELDELEFDVLCTPASWEAELTSLGLIRGKLLPSALFAYYAMFIHAMAPVAVSQNCITIRIRTKGLIGNYAKALYEQTYETGYYTPTGETVPIIIPFPALVSISFATTTSAAYDHTKGAVTSPPITLPEPFGGLTGRHWILSRQNAKPIYIGETLDTVQGLWQVTKAFWYVPIP